MFSFDLIACYTASCDISHMLVFFMYYIVVYNLHVLYFSLTNATASCVKTHMLVLLNVFVFNVNSRQVRV